MAFLGWTKAKPGDYGGMVACLGFGEKLKRIGKKLGGANIMRKDIKKGKKQI